MTIIDNNQTHTDDSLERRVAELEAANARLMEKLEAAVPPAAPSDETEPSGSRRNLFKLAAGAAAGGTALALAKTTGPVAALDNQPINAGVTNEQGDSGPTTTVLRYTNAASPETTFLLTTSNANIMTVRDDPGGPFLLNSNSSAYPAALGGYAYSKVPNGVYGYAGNSSGHGVVAYGGGTGSAGLLARGSRANVEMFPAGDAPSARTDAHVVGEIVADANGDLWYCSVAGTPGTWQQLAGPNLPAPTSVASFTAVTPFRVYDSRKEAAGAFTGGENRTVPVADSRDVDSYAVVTADAVPAGATAVTGNVVAIGTTDTGFLSINPGGTTAITAATVNWAAGLNIGNAGVFALNASRELEAVFGPGNGAHMTIDITGYYT